MFEMGILIGDEEDAKWITQFNDVPLTYRLQKLKALSYPSLSQPQSSHSLLLPPSCVL